MSKLRTVKVVMLLRNALKGSRLRLAFYVLCVGLLGILIVREHGAIADSVRTASEVSPVWILAGFGMLLFSVVASSALYGVLSPQPLRFGRTLLVQLGSMGVNRLLPAGSGALGISYLYLRANQVGKATAVTVVAANNLLGFIGHALLLSLVLVFSPAVIRDFGINGNGFTIFLIAAAILTLLLGVVILAGRKSAGKFVRPLQPLLKKPGRFIPALGYSLVITASYAAAMLLAANSIGIQLSPAAALVVLSFGVAAASAIPTPGGVGAAEAGVFAALKAYGISNDEALAVALLYRVMTFWLPLIVGGLAFTVVDRYGYLKAARKS
jgi:uncharacterized membrane protein YbhN (UPF0104 family)